MKFLTIRLSIWRGPRYTSGRGKSYRKFPSLSDARGYAERRGYRGIKIVC